MPYKTQRMQQTSLISFISKAFLFSGYICFVISLFMPSLIVGWLDGNDTILGFHALAASPFFAITSMTALLYGDIIYPTEAVALFFSNLFIVVSYPIYRIYIVSRDNKILLVSVVLTSASWLYPVKAERFPSIGGIGYYLWATSITLVSLSLFAVLVSELLSE